MNLKNKLAVITATAMLAFVGTGFAAWTFTKSVNADVASITGKVTAAIEAKELKVQDGSGNDVAGLYLICDAPAGQTDLLAGEGIYWSTKNDTTAKANKITSLKLIGSVNEDDNDIADITTYDGGSHSSEELSSSEEEYSRSRRSSSSSSTFSGDPNVDINNYGTIRFEAENINTANWVTSSIFPTPVMASEKASGGYYLASSTGDTANSGTCDFVLKLNQPSKITMTAAYCQSSKWLDYDEDMSLTYAFVIETTSQQIPYGEDHILRARTEEFDWYRMTYRPITLPKGDHKITMSVISNTSTGCPCTDYLDFLIEEPSGDVDPEPPVVDSVPDNDFHTLVQYQYINDPDWHNIRNYAQGTTELSLPRGLELKFDDLNDASNYYVQVSKGDNDFTDEPVRVTTNKYYELWNAELGETYYYKAAVNQADLDYSALRSSYWLRT